ncbi:MAG: AAA family ATPase [Bacilli bacterium]
MLNELRFIELNEDKSPKNTFDQTFLSMDSLQNAGLLLNSNVVVIDFDGDNDKKEASIINYIKEKYPTLMVCTDKGVHFYYSRPQNVIIKGNVDQITVGGFQCDYRTGERQYVVVKLHGMERKRNRPLTLDGLPILPYILYPLSKNRVNLSNMMNHDGRNDSIFKHLCSVRYYYSMLNIEQIGNFINNNIFTDPLSEKELRTTINSVLSQETISKPVNQPLDIISAFELKKAKLKPIKFIVEDMLPQGLNLICSPPKYGKSWLMLDLCLSVASGKDFLNHKTTQCKCLYLALEDSKNRLKDRMEKILHEENPSLNFDFALKSGIIGTNLIEQLNQYVLNNPDTGLIVIDTLQKVRGNSSKGDNSYSNDYRDLGILKNFADEKGICLLLVHHLRKMNDTSDVFAKISGTNALMGASDTIFILNREKRTDSQTILTMTGRDIEENEYILEFDKSSFKWRLLGDYESQIQQKQWEEYTSDPIVQTIKTLIGDNGKYEGTAGDINNKCVELFGETASIQTALLGKKIRALASLLNFYDNIIYEAPPENGKGGKRLHKFKYAIIDFSKNQGTTDTTGY